MEESLVSRVHLPTFLLLFMTSSSSGFRVGEAESCGGEAGEDGNIYHYKEQLEQISVWLVGDDFEDFSCALDGLKCILSSILDGDLGRDHLSIIALDSISSKYSESYLSRISRVLLSRDYSNESDIVNEVSKILRMIIKVILDHLPLDNMKVVEALHYLFDPSCRFYANAGLTRPDPLSFLSEKEKASLADFKSNLTVNDWVDVSHGDLWHAAQIVDMEYQQIKVCYEASVNFNEEWIDLNSARILPFRRRSFEKVLEPWRLDLKISSKCDVIDGINKWYTATILEYRERDDCFLFNYDGWTHKYDEWISRSSYRLAPFLSIARGGKNTGGVKMESLELYLKSESETSDDCAIFRGKDWGGFHIVDNLNFFAKKLGFEKLKLQVKNLNLDLLMLYITFMSKIYLLFSQSFCSKFLLPFTQEIFLAIVYLNDIELRQLSKDKFHIICENSERVLRRLFSQYHTESRMVAFKSQVALRNFKSPIVERRLNGFDFFIETLGRLQKVDLPSSFNMNDEFVCSKKKFLKWLENNHVYEDVFASLERSHVELLKRSPELLNYYSLENCFESYHLDLIWNLLLQALAIGDNAAEIAVYKVLEQCCSFLNEANLRYLLLKLRYLESKFWSASIISLISLLSNYLTCEESIKEILSLLWNHFEDPMRVDYNKNIATLSMQKFVELIGRVEAKGQRFIFLNRAIGNLKQSPMVLQSLEIIKSIVSTYPIDEFPAFRSEPGQEALIQELESKFKIVRCVLHDIKSFKSLYKESFGDSLLTETILNGYTYLDNIKKRLQFVSYISLYSKMHIALDLLANIWHELFSCALYDCELEIFLDWLVEISAFPSESLSQFDLRPSVIDPDTLIKFFSTKLLSIPCEKVSIRSFHSLKIIMIRVNNLLGYLDDSLDSSLSQTKKVLFVVSNFNAIIGLDFSWTLVWETDNSEVLDQAVDFLLSLHNRLSDEEFSRKGNEIMKLYIKRCMDNFINFFSNQNFKKVRRCLILLNRLLDVYDFKHRFQQFVSRGKPTNCTYSYNPHQKLASEDPVEITVVNNVRNSNLPRSFIIQIYESDSMNDIRELLAASIGILPWYLRVFIDGKEVSFSEAEIVNTSSLMLDLKRPLSSCKNIVVAKNAFLNKRVELIDPISKELTNAAKSAFSKIFYRFCSSNFGVMFQEDFEKYILSCGADNAYSRVGTINEIFAEYSTKTNHHISERNQSVDLNLNLNECSPRERILDADNNHLSLENFLEFYQHYAENRPHFVWSDLQTHGFLEDLSDERIAVQQYFKQIYNDNFNPGMHLSGCNNEQDSKIFGTSSEPIFSLLFDAVGVKELEEDAWHLLMRIPTSCHLKSSILSLQLQDSSTIGWKKIVNRESPSKQLYVLQILQSIIIRSAQDFNKSFFDWMICFLKTGGLSCLFEILLSFPTEMSLCRFSRSSIYTLVQIITAFSMESLEIKSGIKRKLTALWENYSRCIKSYNNSLSARDSSDTPQPISDGAVSTSSKPYEFPFSDLIEECGASVLRENPELAKFVLEDVNLCILATRSIEIIKSIGNLTANKDPLSYGDRKVFIFCVLNIFMAVIESSDDLMPIIAAFVSNSFSSVIQILISHDLEVRHLASFLVLSFCDFSDSLLRPTFMKLMDYLLSSDISLNANYESFFLALLKILDLVLSAPLDKDIILHNYLIEKTQLLMNLLTEKSFFENGDTITHETFLAGLLQVESKLVSTLSLDSIWKNDVIKSIHSTLLFGNSITTKSICLFQNIRKLTFDLLFSLACKSAVCFQQLWDLLAVQFDRISKPIPWNYQPGKSLKSPIGYVGLKNQGSTCYMNSLLQQLFLIPQFRQGIFSAVSELSLTQTSLLYQLQVMFGFLLASERQYFETKPFCEAYTDEDGNPIDIRVQQDAQEFFSVFTDRIEMALKSSSQKYLMKSTFGGKLCNQFICLGCNNIREREEEFFTVSLEVSSRSSLVESLKAYVSDEMLTGVHCDACGEKSNTTRRVVLSELPETMIFHLKRFQLNFETFTNEKLNDRFEFPFKVDLEPYTKQHILQENVSQSHNGLLFIKFITFKDSDVLRNIFRCPVKILVILYMHLRRMLYQRTMNLKGL